jgi:hypothetical protein
MLSMILNELLEVQLVPYFIPDSSSSTSTHLKAVVCNKGGYSELPSKVVESDI